MVLLIAFLSLVMVGSGAFHYLACKASERVNKYINEME